MGLYVNHKNRDVLFFKYLKPSAIPPVTYIVVNFYNQKIKLLFIMASLSTEKWPSLPKKDLSSRVNKPKKALEAAGVTRLIVISQKAH